MPGKEDMLDGLGFLKLMFKASFKIIHLFLFLCNRSFNHAYALN